MLSLYRFLTFMSAPALHKLLKLRLKKGKEDGRRIQERMGIACINRPDGNVFWVHAASVGEAQSALILIKRLLALAPDLHVLITSGTVTSAAFLSSLLPARAVHQFYPLDHPKWVDRFLNHWRPDAALWIESELWPNMLAAVKKREIPAILVNARMSEATFNRWRLFKKDATRILGTFDTILAQTKNAVQYYQSLGHPNVYFTDNLKYSAAPLSYLDKELKTLEKSAGGRAVWVYASTHAGEEQIAINVHKALSSNISGLLTIIVPRHPERREDIKSILDKSGLQYCFRSQQAHFLTQDRDIYLADTMGELGLFYKFCPIAMIGRSLSDDGGGGHNPLEAAQLNCAVLSGENVKYQAEIFEEMREHDAVLMIKDENMLKETLLSLLSNPLYLSERADKAYKYAALKTDVIDIVMGYITPILSKHNLIDDSIIKGVR